MNYADKIIPELLRVDFAADDKEHALRQIATLAASSPRLRSFGAEAIYRKLADREAAVSTGLGDGIAIPHARIAGLADFAVFVLVAPKGVDFEALDARKVHLFFVVFAPEDRTNDQLKMLASISLALSQGALKRELLHTTTTRVLHEVLLRATAGDDAARVVLEGPKKLLFIVLFYEEDLSAVLEYLVNQGIEGATITEAKGMGAYISAMPLFASFLGFMREDRHASHTVMALIAAEQEQALVAGVERITGDLDKKQGALLITVDVAFHKGTMDMI